MPSAVPLKRDRITKFTNCRLLKGDKLVKQDLWVSSATGKILKSQEIFYSHQIVPDATINLGGRIVSPGLIDVQLNGAFGFDFSSVPEDMSVYGKTLREVNKSLIKTGVTAYLPTLTSQRKDVYHKVSILFFRYRRYHLPHGVSHFCCKGEEGSDNRSIRQKKTCDQGCYLLYLTLIG